MDFGDGPDDLDIDDLEDLLIDEPDVPSEDEFDPPTATQIVRDLRPAAPPSQTQQQPAASTPASTPADISQCPPGLANGSSRLSDTFAEPSAGGEDTRKRALDKFLDDTLSDDLLQLGKRRVGPVKFSGPPLDEDLEADDIIGRIREGRTSHLIDRPETNGHVRTDLASDSARVHTRLPSSGDFQKLTFPDGRRYYLSVNKDPPLITDQLAKLKTGLLHVSFEQLKTESAALEERRRVQQQEQAVLDKLDSWTVRPAVDKHTNNNNKHGGKRQTAVDSGDSALWAQHFQPRVYTELISDEVLNRSLLRWIKLWDKIVFSRDVVSSKPKEDKKPNSDTPAFKGGKQFGSTFVARKPLYEVVEELDAANRPRQRAALLCGPPGLGKTTLAHVLAQHAGYNVVELNASDDRSVAAFRTALENSTQMRSLLGEQPRPNCLIIDEIDGAPAPTINFLVSVLSAKDVTSTTAAPSGGRRRKREGPTPVNRPIVCICNDLYTPSLRPLRQVALVLPFTPISSERLAVRLLDICRRKQLQTDLGALLCLCERTTNDVRSCLGFLQFVRERDKILSLRQVQTSSVGQKDHHKSLFSAWGHIFTISPPKRPVDGPAEDSVPVSGRGGGVADLPRSAAAVRFQSVARAVGSCGEYDKQTQGIFENYLSVQSKEVNMRALCGAIDWMCFNDAVSSEIMRTQNYVLMPYQLFVGVAVHMLLATPKRHKLIFPQAQYEARQRRTRTSNLVSSVGTDMLPGVRCFNSSSNLVLDVLPLLLPLVQPTLRPVNCQLYTARETAELRRVIDVMISYNLTYRQQQTEDGQYQFILDPDVEEVVFLGDHKPQRALQYTIKQLVAREIELEKMRRAERALSRPTAPVGAAPAAAPTAADGNEEEDDEQLPATPSTPTAAAGANGFTPNHKRLQLTPKPISKPDKDPGQKEPRDFFGRVIKKPVVVVDPNAPVDENETAGRLLRADVWYHFKVGYNNAVRRTVRIRDFL